MTTQITLHAVKKSPLSNDEMDTNFLNLRSAADAAATAAAAALTSIPPATSNTIGGIKVGSGLAMDGAGVLSATANSTYSLPPASSTTLGGIKIGSGLSIDGAGVVTATGSGSGTLVMASPTTLGGIKIGSGLSIDGAGVVTASGGEIPVLIATAQSNTTSLTLPVGKWLVELDGSFFSSSVSNPAGSIDGTVVFQACPSIGDPGGVLENSIFGSLVIDVTSTRNVSASFTTPGLFSGLNQCHIKLQATKLTAPVGGSGGTTTVVVDTSSQSFSKLGVALVDNAEAYGPYAHGLGVTPKMIQVFFRCISAEWGWQVGDTIDISSAFGEHNNNSNVISTGMAWANTTSVGFSRYGSVGTYVTKKDGSGYAAIDLTKWVLDIIAVKDVVGAVGPIGPEGPAGPQGDQGIPGIAAITPGGIGSLTVTTSTNSPNYVEPTLPGTWTVVVRDLIQQGVGDGGYKFVTIYQRTA